MPLPTDGPLRLGVVKLASCDGCQLALLGLGPLLDLAGHIDIVEFGEASSTRSAGPYDLLLVEGSVSTEDQARHVRELRARTRLLVTIGACATSGGIQALRGWATGDGVAASVYPRPDEVQTLATATPVAEHVAVDAELRGCPIDGGQLLELITALSMGRRPQLPDEAVCAACKRSGLVCVVVAHGEPCLGPITRTGCGALCPAYARGCYACFGPREAPNVEGLAADLRRRGFDDAAIARRLAGFTAWAPELRAAITARGGPPGFPIGAAMVPVPGAGQGSTMGRERVNATTIERRLDVESVSRVEGEGRLRVLLRGDQIVEAKLSIFEAPRFFERLVVGRSADEVIDIVARICGICPVAYQLTAAIAFERLFGVELDPAVRQLRRLLYWGEWLQSHALHLYLLHAPDFLGYPDALAMARDHRAVVERGLALKGAGVAILELLGGRAVHPVSVRVGGFSRVPTRAQLARLHPTLEAALEDALATVRWVAGFDFPSFAREPALLALRDPGSYSLDDGAMVTSDGLELSPADWEAAFTEEQVAHSTALHARGVDGRHHLLGPAARIGLAADRLHPTAAAALAECGGPERIRTDVFRSILARAVEMVQAVAESLAILEAYQPPPAPSVRWTPRAGRAAWSTEAPRGLLFHRYDVDDAGLVTAARIVPPTSQNQASIEDDLRGYLPEVLRLPDAEATARLEALIRCYDPCISCATHFLTLDVEREAAG